MPILKRLVSLYLLCILTPWCAEAQLSFTNRSIDLSNPTLSSGFSIGICDLNNDGLDDLVRFNGAKNLEIEFQQQDQSFEKILLGSMSNDVVYSISAADIDNNGFNDLITGGFYEPVKILWANQDGTDYIKDTLEGPLVFMQGANFSDIDNDGLIDYFICHDDFISQPYRNQGEGRLVYDENLFDATSTVQSNNSGNYSAVWTDYDSDGDIDMYLSKCRLGVNDPMNGDRINVLYRNDGSGNYTDVAEESGLRPLAQSWASDFADFDNDGDMDAFIINHDKDSFIYQNDGEGKYSIMNIESGIGEDLKKFKNGLQVIVRDFDNDGFQDIFLTTFFTHFLMLKNNGDFTFTKVPSPFGVSVEKVQSAAVGDLNNDGFVDILAGFSEGVNVPNNSMPDRLYANVGNDNNWIRLHLEGVESNYNAIGSRLELYGEWGKQLREIRSGEGYGIMNSMHKIFGIGLSNKIDSLRILWPSGKLTVVKDPPINTTLKVTEGRVIDNKELTICQGDSVRIGDRFVKESGFYQELIEGIEEDTLLNLELQVNPISTVNLERSICIGDSLAVGDSHFYEAGNYTLTLENKNGCDSLIDLTLDLLPSVQVVLESKVDDTSNGNGSIEISIEGGLSPYSVLWSNGEEDVLVIDSLEAGDYSVTIIDANNCQTILEYTIDFVSSVDLTIWNEVELYPVPTADDVVLSLPSGHNYDRFQIFTLIGQSIGSHKLTNLTEITIGLSSSHKGVLVGYLINNQGEVSPPIKLIRI